MKPASLGLGWGEVDQSQLVQDLLDDRAGEVCRSAGTEREADERLDVVVATGGHQRADPPQVPSGGPGALGVDEQAPLDLRANQRAQTQQVDLPGPPRCRRGGAPPTKRRLVGVVDRDRPAELFVAVPPRRRQPRAAGPFVTLVAAAMPRAQAKRRVGEVGTDRHPTGPVAGKGQLLAQPRGQVRGFAVGLLVVLPSAQMPLAQPQLGMRNRPLRTHPAGQLLGPHVALQTRCGGEKRGLAHAALTFARPLPQMLRAQIRAARPRSLTAVRPHTPSDRSGAGAGSRSRPGERSDRTKDRRSGW